MQDTFVVGLVYGQNLQGFVTIINYIINTTTGAQSLLALITNNKYTTPTNTS
jgi:hypothetical protein